MVVKISLIPAIIIVAVLIGGVYLLIRDDSDNNVVSAANVRVADGKQFVEIRAKGGYQPRKSTAKAGMPTVLRFNTSGTFDCTASVRIPSLNISKSLPPTGETDIDLGSVAAGKLKGTCGMGMYPFEVDFGW